MQIQLYGDVPVGAARFADLARGVQGVGYRNSKIDFVNEACLPCDRHRSSLASEVCCPMADAQADGQLLHSTSATSDRSLAWMLPVKDEGAGCLHAELHQE